MLWSSYCINNSSKISNAIVPNEIFNYFTSTKKEATSKTFKSNYKDSLGLL